MSAANGIRTYKDYLDRTYFRRVVDDGDKWIGQFPDGLTARVAHIPARCGSTRIADKNIRELCGLPLLAYSILLAKRLAGVDRVIVNTDSPRYAEIARHYGAETPFLRPAELATSTSNSYWSYYFLFRHLVEEDYPVKTIMTLCPTNPFRNLQDLQALVERLDEAGMVQSCLPVACDPDALCTGGGSVRGLAAGDLGLVPGGYVYKPLGTFQGQHVFHAHIRRKELVPVCNPVELIDIDTEEDFRLAAEVVANGLYDFGMVL